MNLDFYLVGLVLEEREENVERNFKKHIIENPHRTFLRITWEDIYRYILNNSLQNSEKITMLNYFKNKSIGYKKDVLQKAFSI